MNQLYDCIVVGGGPAGATVAYHLAKKNRKVIILEKNRFPRYKPCAGGLTPKAFNLLDFSISELIEFESRNVVISFNHKMYRKICGAASVTIMVKRDKFDHYFLCKAQESGSGLIEGVKITDIEFENQTFCVKTPKGIFKSFYLVGADGANSFVNNRFKIVNKNPRGFAVEINYPMKKEDIAKYEQTFEFGLFPDGYLWIFPKSDQLSIGAYSSKPKMKTLKKHLLDYLKYLGFSDYNKFKMRGHIIPFYGINYIQPNFPCILVGDAAGFSDYLTGEGIFYAMKSGIIAADIVNKSIDKGNFFYRNLQRKYNKEIIRGLKLGCRFGKSFYERLPRSLNFISREWLLKISLLAAYKGITYDRLLPKIPYLFLKSLTLDLKIKNLESLFDGD